MSDEQAEMVRRLCTSGQGVDIVEGVAGAGKTFALAAANQAWSESGHTVVGCALAAKAARQLQTDADIPSHTIDRLLIDLDRPEHGGLASNTVIVVDEAAMVGTRKVLRLLDHARQADAKVVLIGDPCQLPEIEAGGAFVGLRQRLESSHLTENRRQREPWERAALAHLRAGDTDAALDTYLRHGRVEIAPTSSEARSRMVGDWLVARRTGTAVMLASRRADVDALNRSARSALRREGKIGADQIVIASHGYAEGDVVVALRNDRRLGLLNGTRAVVEQIDTSARVVRCRIDDGPAVTIPFDYASDGHLNHGYAMTIHKSQGATYDRCLVLAGDQLTKESAYTAMSRGRAGNTLYLVDDNLREADAHTDEIESSLVDRVRASISRTGTQSMAIEQETAAGHDDLDVGMDP
ncbi:MAG: AAA family ATPase [Acidimicrobiales bacterium]